ncbi:MAG: molybdenum cofactor guanylyltransferase [Planctomycetes bacterium]|nr:molybdenum cofactor guanylyltransferase [Planctomycetota bacterium]
MIKLDNMLMIGSSGANVGKTELACAILKKFGKNIDIIGVKVTTVQDTNGQCPRGGQGCGVCSSLDGVFHLTEETDSGSGKDTSKLLASGANRVFWLQVLRDHLAQGATALLDVIGPDAVSVCESNSLRQAVEPGLFLMLGGRDVKTWKSSARQVREYADRIVVSDGRGFDLDLDAIKLIGGRWRMRQDPKGICEGPTRPIKATAIIMAGGGSGRMGTDKSLLPVNGRPIIENIYEQLRGHFDQILISANEQEKLAFLALEVVPDRIAGQGPLMGMASALEASRNELNFVVACDIPHIDIGRVGEMLGQAAESGAQVVIPTTGDQKYEPLFAVYHRSALEAMNKVLSSGGRKISDIFALCRVEYVELGDAEWFINLNTRTEYEGFREKHGD